MARIILNPNVSLKYLRQRITDSGYVVRRNPAKDCSVYIQHSRPTFTEKQRTNRQKFAQAVKMARDYNLPQKAPADNPIVIFRAANPQYKTLRGAKIAYFLSKIDSTL